MAGTLLSVTVVSSATAEDKDLPKPKLTVSTTLEFEVKANFYNLGGFARHTAIGAAGSSTDQYFDDGYNKVEGLGFVDNRTYRWGYGNASQLAGGAANLHSSTSVANVNSFNNDGGPQPGMGVTYQMPLRKLSHGGHWGVSAGLNFQAINVQDKRSLAGNADVLTRSFSTAGSTIPPTPTPPYDGEAGGFNPATRILNSSVGADTLTTVPGGAVLSGLRELDAKLFTLKVGPYFEYPLGKKFTLGGGAGFALGVLASDFNYNETTTIPGMLTAPTVAGAPIPTVGGLALGNAEVHRGASSKTGVLPGAYVNLDLGYEINSRWSAHLGTQFRYLGEFNQTATDQLGNTRGARLKLGEALQIQLGLGYSF